MIRRPPRSTRVRSSAASDVYKRQHQELAIMTGAVELMVTDIQCVFQGLVGVAKNFHTHVVTTSQKAHIEGAMRVEFHEDRALEIAKDIVRMAIDNYENRDVSKVHIPNIKS